MTGLAAKDLGRLASYMNEGQGPAPSTPLGAARLLALPPLAMIVFIALFFFGLDRTGLLLLLAAAVLSLPAAFPTFPRRLGLGFEFDPTMPLSRVVMLAPWAVFMMGFFTVHFVGFHFVHSIFLNGFFPLTQMEVFGTSPGGTAFWFLDLIGKAVSAYWPFLLFSAVSSRREYRKAALETDQNTIMGPYKNVIRMHILIFVFAGLHFAGLSGYAIYPVLLFYFFPLRAVTGVFRRQPAEV